MSPADSDRKAEALPEQKVGDTPTAPWQMPTPEEKQAAKPVKQALTEALAEIHTEADAERVIDELEATAGDAPAKAVAPPEGTTTAPEAAQAVKQAAEVTPPAEKPAEVITETAKAVESAAGRDKEVLAEAAQEVFAPRQQGAVAPPLSFQRELLRRAVLHRLKPYEALDTNLFIQVNHLPHTRLSNGMFYGITLAWNGGAAWYVLMGLSVLLRRRWDRHMFWASAVPLTVATALVEHPIKAAFRRRRPFISIVRAIVVGKKPGTWSFPSGHSASAFAGAWLLRQHFPRLAPLLYSVAALVAFSRIYLGDHYPSDVVTGSALGHLFAMVFGRLFGHKRR